MKNPFKDTNVLEKIGVALLVLSVVFMVTHERVGEGLFSRLGEQHYIVFWLGLLIWALGYMMREQAAKKK